MPFEFELIVSLDIVEFSTIPNDSIPFSTLLSAIKLIYQRNDEKLTKRSMNYYKTDERVSRGFRFREKGGKKYREKEFYLFTRGKFAINLVILEFTCNSLFETHSLNEAVSRQGTIF